jgi:hypothetical protein
LRASFYLECILPGPAEIRLPDPCLGDGGIHLSRHGGHLDIHADFNWHEKLQRTGA